MRVPKGRDVLLVLDCNLRLYIGLVTSWLGSIHDVPHAAMFLSTSNIFFQCSFLLHDGVGASVYGGP